MTPTCVEMETFDFFARECRVHISTIPDRLFTVSHLSPPTRAHARYRTCMHSPVPARFTRLSIYYPFTHSTFFSA